MEWQSINPYFSDLTDSVVPVLRKSETKFKKPASFDIKARARISNETENKFRQQFKRKGRATIPVSVEISDVNGAITMTGISEWFIQQYIPPNPGKLEISRTQFSTPLRGISACPEWLLSPSLHCSQILILRGK